NRLQDGPVAVRWQRSPSPMKNRILLATSSILAMAVTVAFTAGCTTKNYVRNQTTPIINKTNELDELTAKTTNQIRDVDTRAQQGIQGVNDKAAAADQKASVADQNATQAGQVANSTFARANEMENIVANLDQYKTVVETDVHFAFNSDKLSSKAKDAL